MSGMGALAAGNGAVGPVPREINAVGTKSSTCWNDHCEYGADSQLSSEMPTETRPGAPPITCGRGSRACDEPRDDRRGRHQGRRDELRLHALDPALAAFGEPVVLGLQVSAGDEHAELGALRA